MENKPMMVIDATGLIVGRLATKVAKLALLGNQIAVVNCEHAVFSGSQEVLISKWHTRMLRVQPFKGPYISRMPDRLVKSVIRGMLPHGKWSEKSRGRSALSRIKCYLGVPQEFKSHKFEKIEGADASNLKTTRMITVGELARLLRGRLM